MQPNGLERRRADDHRQRHVARQPVRVLPREFAQPRCQPRRAFIRCGGAVLIQGDALPLLYRATLALIARRSRDGLAAQPLLRLSRTTFYRACMSAQRRKGAAYHLAESRCNGQGRLANPKTS